MFYKCLEVVWKRLPKNKVHNNLTKPLWATEIQSQLAAHHGRWLHFCLQRPKSSRTLEEDKLTWRMSCPGITEG